MTKRLPLPVFLGSSAMCRSAFMCAFGLAVLHVAAGGGPLEVAVELDAVGRVEVDALHLAAQALALSQTRHHLERIAEDHAVGPILVVLIELGFVNACGDADEV